MIFADVIPEIDIEKLQDKYPKCENESYLHECFGEKITDDYKYIGFFKDNSIWEGHVFGDGILSFVWFDGERYSNFSCTKSFDEWYYCPNGDKKKSIGGNLQYNEEKETYERTGKWKYIWASGSVYEGEYKKDYRWGKGKYTWAKSGNIYEGDFIKGDRTGKGKYTWAKSGNVYEGDFIKGDQTGKGKHTYANGKYLLGGEWVKGKLSGVVTNYNADGTIEGLYYYIESKIVTKEEYNNSLKISNKDISKKKHWLFDRWFTDLEKSIFDKEDRLAYKGLSWCSYETPTFTVSKEKGFLNNILGENPPPPYLKEFAPDAKIEVIESENRVVIKSKYKHQAFGIIYQTEEYDYNKKDDTIKFIIKLQKEENGPYVFKPNFKGHTWYNCPNLEKTSDQTAIKNNNSSFTNNNIPENAYKYENSWKCKSGFYSNGEQCFILPDNAYTTGYFFICNKGFEKTGNVCKKIISDNSLYASLGNEKICEFATTIIDNKIQWASLLPMYTKEAKKRGLDCNVGKKINKKSSNIYQSQSNKTDTINSASNQKICNIATTIIDGKRQWDQIVPKFIEEAKKRNLDCGVLKRAKLSKNSKSNKTVSNAIRLFGIGFGLSYDEIIQILEPRYKCKKSQSSLTCSNNNKKINVQKDVIKFSCGNFNACDYTLEEIADSFINESLVVSNFEYNQIDIVSGDFIYYLDSYCARGRAGELLCVQETLDMFGGFADMLAPLTGGIKNNPPPMILLKRSRFGKTDKFVIN
tara:strand:- start:732 stop:2984 length:2253 start_codon:yes stop_codon:yes gene_type:complete